MEFEPYDPESGEQPAPVQLFISPGGDPERDPALIAARLLEAEETFAHLRGTPDDGAPTIVFLMRGVPKSKGGKQILGEMIAPKLNGPTLQQIAIWALARLCEGLPDYVMVLDAAWWSQASPREREALVWHELEHAWQERDKQGEPRFLPSGLPAWGIKPHDVSSFDSEVARFGAWSPELRSFVGALRRGGAI